MSDDCELEEVPLDENVTCHGIMSSEANDLVVMSITVLFASSGVT